MLNKIQHLDLLPHPPNQATPPPQKNTASYPKTNPHHVEVMLFEIFTAPKKLTEGTL